MTVSPIVPYRSSNAMPAFHLLAMLALVSLDFANCFLPWASSQDAWKLIFIKWC